MKKTIFTAISFFIVLFSTFTASAQDVIHRKNGKTLEVKIVEIGDVDVKYKLFTQPDGPTYVMDATLVKKVVFANGAIHKFEDSTNTIDNAEYYVGQNKTLWKVGFLDFIRGFTSVTYEHSLKPGASYEIRLAAIGLGRDGGFDGDNYNYGNNRVKTKQRGAFASIGYKFIRRPDIASNRQRFSHLLNGTYIRPELNLGSYGVDRFQYSGGSYAAKRVQTTYGSALLSAGKQYVFENKFAVDLSFGVGFGVKGSSGSTVSYEYSSVTQYGNTIFPNGLSFNLGLSIGLLSK